MLNARTKYTSAHQRGAHPHMATTPVAIPRNMYATYRPTKPAIVPSAKINQERFWYCATVDLSFIHQSRCEQRTAARERPLLGVDLY